MLRGMQRYRYYTCTIFTGGKQPCSCAESRFSMRFAKLALIPKGVFCYFVMIDLYAPAVRPSGRADAFSLPRLYRATQCIRHPPVRSGCVHIWKIPTPVYLHTTVERIYHHNGMTVDSMRHSARTTPTSRGTKETLREPALLCILPFAFEAASISVLSPSATEDTKVGPSVLTGASCRRHSPA